jgi:hypothetical protein
VARAHCPCSPIAPANDGRKGPDIEDKKDHQIQLDASVVFGYFNYFLGHGYAVDEQLFRMIVEQANTNLRRLSHRV